MTDPRGTKEPPPFDPAKFAKHWTVISGSSAIGEGLEIRQLDAERFELWSGGERRQSLVYNPTTRTLENDSGEAPDRSISYWDRKARGGAADRIFAMRRAQVGVPGESPGLLPFERRDPEDPDNGTWGAEEGSP